MFLFEFRLLIWFWKTCLGRFHCIVNQNRFTMRRVQALAFGPGAVAEPAFFFRVDHEKLEKNLNVHKQRWSDPFRSLTSPCPQKETVSYSDCFFQKIPLHHLAKLPSTSHSPERKIVYLFKILSIIIFFFDNFPIFFPLIFRSFREKFPGGPEFSSVGHSPPHRAFL